MQRWEYTTIVTDSRLTHWCEPGETKWRPDAHFWIAELGSNGWELVNTTETTGQLKWFFKRPLP